MNDADRSSLFGDDFDQMLRRLDGIPNSIHTQPATRTSLTPLTSVAKTWIVQTFRLRDSEDEDTPATSQDIIFLQNIAANTSMRIVIPPDVANVIARQREALTSKNRKRGARQAVETRRRKK